MGICFLFRVGGKILRQCAGMAALKVVGLVLKLAIYLLFIYYYV